MKTTMAIGLSVLAAALFVSPALAEGGGGLPDGFKGFRGLLRGSLVSKTENQLVLKVQAVVKTWPANKATEANVVLGKDLTIAVKAERLLNALKERKAGDVIVVGVFNEEGNQLRAVEDLRLAEAAGTTPPAAGAEEVARLKARIAELERAVAALKAENEALRKQLAEARGTTPK
jgi:hypothetical protein